MGRAIVRNPQVFLMDEPLSNLDAKLRVQTRTQIAALQKRLATTTVYVTHDQVEAMTMGDRVAVLKDGLLQQVDTPRALYETPSNAFVAGFIGSPAMNLFTTDLSEKGTSLGDFDVQVSREARSATDNQIIVGVRPEEFVIGNDGIPFTVNIIEELGADAFVYGKIDGSGEDIVARVKGNDRYRPGTQLRATPTKVHLFSATGDQKALS
jgi:multiple sugar transport system ATP-binding protein